MQIAQQKAWNHLTKLEQMALNLVVVNERSKKEAAIIMNIAPYKFTEIYLRARKFFVMFTGHYEEHSELIPSYIMITKEDRIFLDQLLGHRKKITDIVKLELLVDLANAKAREYLWRGLFTTLHVNSLGGISEVFTEFDRWNNFRILPKNMQLPAAFPRRKNRSLKKIQQGLYAISDLGWDLIQQRYGTSDIPPMVYIPIIASDDFRGYAIRETKPIYDYMARNRIPVFSKQKLAYQFAELLFDYRRLKKRSTYSARKFWANFRLLIMEAQNYENLVGIKWVEEAMVTQNDNHFLQSIQKRKPRVRGRADKTVFYPE